MQQKPSVGIFRPTTFHPIIIRCYRATLLLMQQLYGFISPQGHIARCILILRSSECKESLLSKLPSATLHLQRYCKNQRLQKESPPFLYYPPFFLAKPKYLSYPYRMKKRQKRGRLERWTRKQKGGLETRNILCNLSSTTGITAKFTLQYLPLFLDLCGYFSTLSSKKCMI